MELSTRYTTADIVLQIGSTSATVEDIIINQQVTITLMYVDTAIACVPPANQKTAQMPVMQFKLIII